MSLLYPIWKQVGSAIVEQIQGLAAGTCSQDKLLTSLTLLRMSNSALQKILVSNIFLHFMLQNVLVLNRKFWLFSPLDFKILFWMEMFR